MPRRSNRRNRTALTSNEHDTRDPPAEPEQPANPESQLQVARISAPIAVAQQIDGVREWRRTVEIVCAAFCLPGMSSACMSDGALTRIQDLSRRSGLKKLHADFDDLYDKMNTAYLRNVGNLRVMGAIVTIWVKMCVDGKLRKRLVHEGASSLLTFEMCFC